ncbi:MAG: PD40 domain-containing protein [Candidatus Zixiibacteriota bacterium]|nr:MAG: PD40 domain-containing protein [candidate division Zixibacteria bacterium]
MSSSKKKGMTMFKGKLITLMIAMLCVNPACGEKSTDPEPFPRTLILDYGAVWSGAHDLIAYIHEHIPGSDDPDSAGIYIIRPDGAGKRMIYQGIFIFGIDWSDDGQMIIANSNYMLVKISYPDGAADTLTGSGQYYGPVWSPDGEQIAYNRRIGDDRGIRVMGESGNNDRLVIAYGDFVNWPYADSILYLNADTAYTVGSLYIAVTSGAYRREIFMDDIFIPTELVSRMHAVTRRIVFHAQLPGETRSLWKLENGFENAVRIKAFAIYPNFSPDGEEIIYTDTHEDNGRLWIINWDGSALRQLTH